jgi:hypothetical protein
MREWDREQFLTPTEVAELLRLNRQTIYNWRTPEPVPVVRIGRLAVNSLPTHRMVP